MVNTKIRLIIFFAAEDGEALCSQQRQDQELDSDPELLIAKFILKLKKAGETTRPFMYDLIKSLMIIQWKSQIDSRD